MILPIVAYGDPVLKKKAKNIDKDYPKLSSVPDAPSKEERQKIAEGLLADTANRRYSDDMLAELGLALPASVASKAYGTELMATSAMLPIGFGYPSPPTKWASRAEF